MRSQVRGLGRLCWPVVRAVARYTFDGMAGFGLVYCGITAQHGRSGQPGTASDRTAPEVEQAAVLSRWERRQWARLVRQLH